MSKVLRASEIGMWMYCKKSYLLLKAGVKAQQTLQDLIQQKVIPMVVARELQQQNIPLSTTIDKVIGQGLLPPKLEKEIIQSNIILQGDLLHAKTGMATQQNAMVQEHRGGWIIVLLIIMMIISFLVLLMLKGGG